MIKMMHTAVVILYVVLTKACDLCDKRVANGLCLFFSAFD